MSDEPIPAATLVVVRDRGRAPPEYLMVERAGGMVFAAGALVFPGGRIDEADRGLGDRLGIDPGIVAAIRETVEETAIPVGLTPLPDAPTAAALQRALVEEKDFAALIDEAGLAIDAGALTPFARWVPKFHAVRRFDTLFYLARAPAGEWSPRVVEGECAGAHWVAAGDVLDRERAGTAKLIFPTRRNLERLAQHASFEEVRSDAQSHPIEPVTPWIEERDGAQFLTIPGHLGYPVTQELLDGQWRG